MLKYNKKKGAKKSSLSILHYSFFSFVFSILDLHVSSPYIVLLWQSN